MTFTVKEVARMYRTTNPTVTTWISNGEMRAINVGVAAGKKKPRWRITQEALDEFEALRASSPPTKQTRRRRKGGSDEGLVDFIG